MENDTRRRSNELCKSNDGYSPTSEGRSMVYSVATITTYKALLPLTANFSPPPSEDGRRRER